MLQVFQSHVYVPLDQWQFSNYALRKAAEALDTCTVECCTCPGCAGRAKNFDAQRVHLARALVKEALR